MTRPFLLVQLSDPHIGATWADGDPVAGLRAAVESVRRLPDAPDAVLMSGDLSDNAADSESSWPTVEVAKDGSLWALKELPFEYAA